MIVLHTTLHEMEGTRARFLRSIRVDTDLHDDAALSGYVVTTQSRSVLERLIDGLEPRSAERAWTLTGPYGTGKSALALFASRLLSDESSHDNLAWRILREQHAAFANELSAKMGEARLLPLLITARRATFSSCLAASVAKLPQSVVEHLSIRPGENPQRFNGVDSEADKDQHGLELIHEIGHAARKSGYSGILLIVDELGKILENVARDPTHTDVFVLQDLAEAASRSGDAPLLVIGVLHQAFEQYAQHLDAAMRREWAKVQGRYADIAFIEPPEQLIRLSSQAVRSTYGPRQLFAEQSDEIAALPPLDTLSLQPPLMSDADFNEIVLTTPAIHPVTLVALPYLFRRFAQNERSLFTYLVSQQPFGLYDQIHRRGRVIVRVPDLFDYAVANLSGELHRHTVHQRWLEVVDALDQAPDLLPLEVDVIKAIGVLSVLADGSHLRASEEMISFSLRDRTDAEDVRDSIKRLRERSMIVYRRFNDSYRVWEGSDVDIDARIDEGRARTAGQFSLAASLRRYLPFRPLVARRHSHEYGTLRHFEVQYLDDLPDTPITPTTSNGIIACCLPSSAHEAAAFQEWASSEDMAESTSVLVALPRQIGVLRELTGELVALHWVQENTPSLRDDRIARRELQQRRSDIEAVIAQQIDQVLDPRPAPLGSGCLWYWQGSQQHASSLRNVNELLSRTMDTLYSDSPRIHNELLNRSSLSSAAAAARRTLIERMLTNAGVERLGIDGFPPERAMYESTLAATSLHREDRGVWRFYAPEETDIAHNLRPAWNHLETIVFGAIDHPVTVDSLFDELRKPPYGITAGFFPVLLCAFLQVRQEEVSLYREDTFIPEPAVADFEILLRRPELFSLAGVSLSGERQVMIARLANSLQTQPAVLPVVRELLRRFRTLPQFAQRTQQLPSETLEVRRALLQARSPERLLFNELPMALCMEPFSPEMPIEERRVAAFFDGLNESLRQMSEITPHHVLHARDILLDACGVETSDAGWSELINLARLMEQAERPPELTPFLKRLSTDGEPHAVLESVLAFIAKRPPRLWSDVDVERFPDLARQIGESFRVVRKARIILTPVEERQCAELTESIVELLGEDVPTHVVRATLSRLMNRL